MNITDAVKRACQEPTLLDALTWIALWESERVVKQARENPTWDTCFRRCFEDVLRSYGRCVNADHWKPAALPADTGGGGAVRRPKVLRSADAACDFAADVHAWDNHRRPFSECDREPCASAHLQALREYERSIEPAARKEERDG